MTQETKNNERQLDEENVINYNLYLDSLKGNPDKDLHLRYLDKYLECLKIIDNDYTLKQAEDKIFSVDNRVLNDNEKIHKVLNTFFYAKNGNKNIKDLINEINSIANMVGITEEEKVRRARRALAKYGIENNVDSYLFSDNKELFEEDYYEVVGRRNSR